MALPATDAFTGTTGTQLAAYSANWTVSSGDFDIQSNALCIDAGTNAGGVAYWDTDSPANDQYAQAVITLATDGEWQYLGPTARVASGAQTLYAYEGCYGEALMFKIVAGSTTFLGSTGSGLRTNDVLRLETSGTTITPKKNGATDSSVGAVTDTSIASGYGGICGYQTDGTRTATRIDNFEVGNLGGTTYQPRPPAAIDSVFMY